MVIVVRASKGRCKEVVEISGSKWRWCAYSYEYVRVRTRAIAMIVMLDSARSKSGTLLG